MTFGSGLKYGYKDQRMEGTYRFSASQMGKLPLREVKWFSQVRMGINSRNWGSVVPYHFLFRAVGDPWERMTSGPFPISQALQRYRVPLAWAG